MTAMLVSALVNATIVSTTASAILWLFLHRISRTSLNAATRFGLWWVALLSAVFLPLIFVPALSFRTPRPAVLGSLPVQNLTRELQVALPLSTPAPAKTNAPASPTRAVTESVQPKTASLWDRLDSWRDMFPIRVRAGLWLNLALLSWLLVSLFFLARLIASYWTLRQRALRSSDGPGDLLDAVNTRPGVRVAISPDIDTPLAIGFRHPAILLPASYRNEFSAADLQSICVHEAAHLNRRDDITLLFQRLIESLLPWHPAVRWIARQLEFEREAACDDWVVQVTGRYKDYALCLTQVAALGGGRDAVLATPTVIGIRSDLARRVDSILEDRVETRPHLRLFRFLTLSLLFTGVVFAGGRVRETIAFREPPQTRDAQIQTIIDDVPAAPPELGADVLLHLVEHGDIADPKQKRQLIEDAWDLAPKAVYVTEFTNAGGGMVESETGSLISSLPGLTTEAIQSRVITQMVTLDPKAARELFLKMKLPEQNSPACTASRYPSHAAYFKALGTALSTFSADEVQRGDAAQFLRNGIHSLTNQQDLFSSLDLIRQGHFPDKDFAQLLDQWSETLSTAHFSDRQFSIISWLFKATRGTAETERDKGRSPDKLLQALRTYFVRQASAVRCEDGAWRPAALGPGVPPTNNEEDARLMFNSTVSELGSAVVPIKPEEIKPAGFDGKAAAVNYLSTDPADKMWLVMTAGRHLRFGTKEQQALNEKNRGPENVAPALTPEQRNTPAWNGEALQYLTQLEAWSKGLGEDDRGVFVMKAEFYGGLLALTTEGKLHDTVMKSYINFLVNSPMKRQSPPEWAWWGIHNLVGSREVEEKRKWLDEIEAAGDTTISLYTRLARLDLDRAAPVPVR